MPTYPTLLFLIFVHLSGRCCHSPPGTFAAHITHGAHPTDKDSYCLSEGYRLRLRNEDTATYPVVLQEHQITPPIMWHRPALVEVIAHALVRWAVGSWLWTM